MSPGRLHKQPRHCAWWREDTTARSSVTVQTRRQDGQLNFDSAWGLACAHTLSPCHTATAHTPQISCTRLSVSYRVQALFQAFWQQWSNAMPLPTVSRLFRSALRTQLVSVANVTTKPAKHTVTAGVSSYSFCELYMPEAGVLSRLKLQRFLINSNRLNFIARSFALLNLNSSSSASHTHISMIWWATCLFDQLSLTNKKFLLLIYWILYIKYRIIKNSKCRISFVSSRQFHGDLQVQFIFKTLISAPLSRHYSA